MTNGKCCTVHTVAYWLVVVGALNWGLVGLGGFFGGDWNLVHLLFGMVAWLENLVYLLVGFSAVMMLFGCKCKKCQGGAGEKGGGCCGGGCHHEEPKKEM